MPCRTPRQHTFLPLFLRCFSGAIVGLWSVCAASAAPPEVAAPPANGSPKPAQQAAALPPDHAQRMARGLELFKAQVGGLLKTHCLKCHGGKKAEGEFDLATREGLLRGGSQGPAVVPFKSGESLLYKLVTHAEEPGMPYEEDKLPERDIAAVKNWIDSGAPYDEPLVKKAAAPKGHPIVTEADRQFWSFRPLATVSPPSVRNDSWCRTAIDRFILAALEAKQLAPSPAVERRKLIRRATFDLIGLPPTPEEIEAFVNNTSPDAYEKVVDRLLASPHYGERWARHWLDLARFAESHGYEQDYDRPSAYHYRDFVIRALNDDMPYDRFVALQVAGDEIDPDNPQALMATGFLGAGTHATQITANQVEKERYDELDDMTATIGTSMLGLTLGCARCHDHKYDPVPQTDYYRMVSTFTTTVRSEMELDLEPEKHRAAKAEYDREHAPLAEALARYEKDQLPGRLQPWLKVISPPTEAHRLVIATEAMKHAALLALVPQPRVALPLVESARFLATPADQKDRALAQWFAPTDPDWRKLNDAVQQHARQEPKPKLTKVMVCSEGLPAIRLHTQGGDFLEKTHFLKRGDPNQKQDEATPSFLQVLMSTAEKEKHWQVAPPGGWRTSYRRRSLANWITDVDKGAGRLLARVIVNRLWQHHFGRGIVATPSDFGAQGERPTHPELLDWLAGELVRGGWRLKPLHRQMMTSAAYMQSSSSDAALVAADPDNKLLGRRGHQRLEAEAIRDSILAASGALDETMFGPGTLDESMRRRSVYFMVKRSKLIPILALFDWPDSLQGLGLRSTTTVAPQALAMMNNPQVQNYARAFARRLTKESEGAIAAASSAPAQATAATLDESSMVRRAYELALGRPPDANEVAAAREFLSSQRQSYVAAGKPDAAELALADFCQSLFCLNEFLFVE